MWIIIIFIIIKGAVGTRKMLFMGGVVYSFERYSKNFESYVYHTISVNFTVITYLHDF